VTRGTVTTAAFVVAIGALFSACSNHSPTAPSNNSPAASSNNSPTPPSSSALSDLKITSMTVSDAGYASGHWQYDGKLRLETGGVALTVTRINVQALLGSTILATRGFTPMVSVSANSSGDAVFAFAIDYHVQASALTVNATVEFQDASGNTGTVSDSGTCFGCWDY
jgi:hypothetical protein